MFENYRRGLRGLLAVALFAAFIVVPQMTDAQETITTSSGLSYIDTKVGDGPAAKAGQDAVVHYTGWL